MPNLKKYTAEERRRRRTLAERKRKAKIKNDPVKAAELRSKDRERYYRNKAEGKIKTMAELTPRERRALQKRNKKNYKAYYDRQKLKKRLEKLSDFTSGAEHPESADKVSAVVSPFSTPRARDDLRVKILRSVGAADISSRTRSRRRLDIIENDEIVLDTGSRSPSPSILDACTPVESSIGSPQNASSIAPDSPSSSISVNVACSKQKLAAKFKKYQRYKARQIQQLQQKIRILCRENEKYRKKVGRCVKLPTVKRVTGIKKINERKELDKENKESITNVVQEFYERDDNSRLCPGKKEFKTKNKIRKQKRYMSATVKDLYAKYISSGLPSISIFKFRRLKPFWVVQPDLKIRDTCLCTKHANMEFLIKSLKHNHIINENSITDVLKSLTCDGYKFECLHRKCTLCVNKIINYKEFDNSKEIIFWSWEKTIKEYNQNGEHKVANVIEKIKISEKPLLVIQKFEKLLIPFLTHCGNINNQYNAMTFVKETPIAHNDCVLHIDFSENYCAKYASEVQSVHFGASRNQMTIHTAVIYYSFSQESPKIRLKQSFATVTESLRHDASAVWAHVEEILKEIENTDPDVETLHIFSDSPTSQYRNRKIFYMITQLSSIMPSLKTVVWHYSECGHGKGAPDGVGGYLKCTADKHVAYGNDVVDVNSFITALKAASESVKIEMVEEYKITEKDWLLPDKLKSFPGSMKVHQVVWNKESNILAFRSLSCYQPECLLQTTKCLHGKHLGFTDTTGNILKDTDFETVENSKTTLLNYTPSNAKKKSKVEGSVSRFSGSKLFVLHRPQKKKPILFNSITSPEKQTTSPNVTNVSIDSDLSFSNIDYINPTPSCSFFENLDSDAFSKYEKTDLSKNLNYKTFDNRDAVDDDSSSDYEIFSSGPRKFDF